MVVTRIPILQSRPLFFALTVSHPEGAVAGLSAMPGLAVGNRQGGIAIGILRELIWTLRSGA